MKKVDKLRQEYEEIQTPQDLDSFMDTCIDQAQKRQSRFTFYRLWKPALSAALIGYLIVLNTVPAFAQSVFAIPLLGDVSRILCVREYQKTSDVDSLSVKVPEVKNTGNPEMEERVNKQIEERINKTTEQLYKDSAQVREMMKKEKVESLTAKTEVTIDYKITCNQKNLLSFQIMTNYQLNTSCRNIRPSIWIYPVEETSHCRICLARIMRILLTPVSADKSKSVQSRMKMQAILTERWDFRESVKISHTILTARETLSSSLKNIPLPPGIWEHRNLKYLAVSFTSIQEESNDETGIQTEQACQPKAAYAADTDTGPAAGRRLRYL